MSVDTVESATTTPLAPMPAPMQTMGSVPEAEVSAAVTEDTKRRLPKPARKRVAHRIVADILSRILNQGDDSDYLDLSEYTADDADTIFQIISDIAKDHERRSL